MALSKIPKGRKLIGDERRELAQELEKQYTAGESIRALVASTGRSYGAVHRMLTLDQMLTLRPRGGPHPRKAST